MRLRSGSDEYYRYAERAERIYDKINAARTTDEKRRLSEMAHDLADNMCLKYGDDDREVNGIIDRYSLRWHY